MFSMPLKKICNTCLQEIKEPVMNINRYSANGATRILKICRPCYNDKQKNKYKKDYFPIDQLTDEQKKDIIEKINLGVNLKKISREYNIGYHKMNYFKTK